MTSKSILIIGAGRMAQAIIEGIRDNQEFKILVSNSGNEQRLSYINNTLGVETAEDWRREVSKADIILLAMPPEAHAPVLSDLAKLVDGQLVLTVAAGIGPSTLETKLPEGTPAAWLMPNTAAKLGQSMTLYAPGKNINQQHVEYIESIIQGIGEYEQVTEQQIHELTAVTGSAPAFIYRMAEALEQITLESGVTKLQARKLVSQMIAGSVEMLKTNDDANELVNQVATPGGSTAAGLEVLDAKQFDDIIRQAIEACRKKAKVLE